MVDMKSSWEKMDIWVSENPMPSIFEKTISTILCNDCECKSEEKYHYVGIKCSKCGSYNTTVLTNTGMPTSEEIIAFDEQERAQHQQYITLEPGESEAIEGVFSEILSEGSLYSNSDMESFELEEDSEYSE